MCCHKISICTGCYLSKLMSFLLSLTKAGKVTTFYL